MEEQPTPPTLSAGPLRLTVDIAQAGILLRNLSDLDTGIVFLDSPGPPLFTVTMRHTSSGALRTIDAAAGWTRATCTPISQGLSFVLSEPVDSEFPRIRVHIEAISDVNETSISWNVRIQNPDAEWGIWRVLFPQIAVRRFAADAELFIPRGPGEVPSQVWDRSFEFRLTYPRDYCGMQYMAVYGARPAECPTKDAAGARLLNLPTTGLYLAHHDHDGSTKKMAAQSDPDAGIVTLTFDHPVENMGVPATDFTLPGRMVWRLFRGDWFDATAIYRAWVRSEARWMPGLVNNRREDTPQWMRDGRVWIRLRGDANTVVPVVKEFAEAIGLPVAFHWYNWHQVPYDNDYPHFFPAKPGFIEGIRELQQAGIKVMPYINGRIWDTRDRGMEDWQFTSVARPSACKDSDGNLYIETYNSKEADGSPVRLAVMCPTTAVWRQTVAGLVQRLFQECGVDGVYIDQIAAAEPQLCFDASHGHPPGGGHWWNDAERELVTAAAKYKTKDRILTTESNAEPHLDSFDGYLNWHWQFENHVPAFPAVYAGAVQLFGRSFRPGPTKALSYRMKSAEQLVFGEQIGWVEDPHIVEEPENIAFLRQLARIRWRLREFFSEGELLRPPVLDPDIPTLRGDWRFPDEWPVAVKALQTGAWQHERSRRVVLLFVNISDEPVCSRLYVDHRDYPAVTGNSLITRITEEDEQPAGTWDALTGDLIEFPARNAFAWMITPKPGK